MIINLNFDLQFLTTFWIHFGNQMVTVYLENKSMTAFYPLFKLKCIAISIQFK